MGTAAAKLGIMQRWLEFFEDNDGGLSMTRLLAFLSFWPASYVVCISTPAERFGVLGLFIGTYAASYLGGKITDTARAYLTKEQQDGGNTNVAVTVDASK